MFDMILENYRKAAESTMKVQQDMLRNWTMQWPQMFGSQGFGLPLMGGTSPSSLRKKRRSSPICQPRASKAIGLTWRRSSSVGFGSHCRSCG